MQTMIAPIMGNLIKQVEKKIIMETLPINEWESYTGWHHKPGEFTYDNMPRQIMKIGDRWSVGYDATRWFKAKVTVPESMDGKKLYLYAGFGGEALVRINGKIVGAFSDEAGWQDRTVVIIDNNKAGDELDIELEATVNCGMFCADAVAGAKLDCDVLKTLSLTLSSILSSNPLSYF